MPHDPPHWGECAAPILWIKGYKTFLYRIKKKEALPRIKTERTDLILAGLLFVFLVHGHDTDQYKYNQIEQTPFQTKVKQQVGELPAVPRGV